MLIIRRLNCTDAPSGIVTLSKWPSGAQVETEMLCISLSTCAPDGHSSLGENIYLYKLTSRVLLYKEFSISRTASTY